MQLIPWQRSTRYPVTRTLSVDAFQLRLMLVFPLAAATRLVGAVGGDVSAVVVAVVVAVAVLEYALRWPTASVARTR